MKINSDILLLIKSIGYRLFGTIATIIISFIFTHNVQVSLEIGIVEVISKIILYYVYDKLWNFVVEKNGKIM